MSSILVFCGLPGSGKSTKAKECKRLYGDAVEVVSTDAIREEIFGDINTQEHNAEVFDIAYKRIKEFSETKEIVIFDATNVTIKSRRRIFNCGINREKNKIICVVFSVPFEKCLMQDLTRTKYVGSNVIEKFYNSFQIPFKEEGWDDIVITGFPEYNGNINLFRFKMEGFDQKSKWHSLPLKEHCDKVKELLYLNNITSPALFEAALLHDYGKLFTQTFDENGEAHYYNHSNVGTYELLTSGYRDIEVLFYVNYHMLPFNWNSEKTINKYNNIFGTEKTSNLLLFNKCDRKGE